MKPYTYPLILSALLFGLIFTACKKDEEEELLETEQLPMHVFVTSNPESNMLITAIEVRIGEEDWTKSIMPPGQVIKSSETQDYYIDIPADKICEFRVGVFSDTLFVSMLHDQDYWSDYNNPFIKNRGYSFDSINLKVKKNPYTGYVSLSSD